MDKREFLRASGALLTGGILSHALPADLKSDERSNWSGNYIYRAKRLDSPGTETEVKRIAEECSKSKALGARHSFNGIADTSGDQISVQNFESMELDTKAHTVQVGGGVRYGKLAPYLDSRGFAVHNLASLPHVTTVGACATATHGSGSKNGNLSTVVTGMELITADGKQVRLSRDTDGDRFKGAVVGLGGLGVITTLTLKVEPTFQMRQVVYENLSFDHLEKHLDDIFAAGYSVSLFTDWQNHRATQVWIKSRVSPGDHLSLQPEFYGAKLATRDLHPLAGHSAENCTEQGGVVGPWYERLPHFRMNFTPSSGAELQSEYFVPREKGYQAILAVEKLREHITPHLFITELRTVDADDLWMSPCYRRPAMTIHFTWKPEWPAVKSILPLVEEQLKPFDARPHWAKLFTMAPERLQALYPKLGDFKDLLKEYDPKGKFRNQFLDTNLFSSPAA